MTFRTSSLACTKGRAVLFSVAGAAFLAACGGASQATEKVTSPAEAAAVAAGVNTMIEVTANPQQGTRFALPEKMRPGMPLVEAKKKTPLDKQRAAIEKSKDPEDREVLSQIVATTVYRSVSDEKDAAKQQAAYDDARAVLRKAIETNGGKAVDAVTLQMLGTFDLIKGDFAAAEQTWNALVAHNPKAKDLNSSKTWWAYAALMQHKNAVALEAVKDIVPSEKDPEQAYIVAWAKMRGGDEAGAWAAITAAAKGWKSGNYRDKMEEAAIVIASRTATPLDAAAVVAAGYGSKADEYAMLVALAQQYGFAGRWQDSLAAVEKAMVAAGDKMPKSDPATLRWLQAQGALRLGDPAKAAEYAKQVLSALAACGDDCKATRADLMTAVRGIGQRFHGVYATSQDDSYYQPARGLYAAVATAGDNSPELANMAKQIETTKANVKAGNGTHDKDVIASVVGLYGIEVQGCYERQLMIAPKTAGALALVLDVTDQGVVEAVSSTPAAGGADLAAVATCATARAKHWKFSSRGKSGKTRITAKFELAPKA